MEMLTAVFAACRKAFGKEKPGESDAHSAAAVLRREYEKLGAMTYVYMYIWQC